MKNPKRPKNAVRVLRLLPWIASATAYATVLGAKGARADKFDIGLGYFNLNAQQTSSGQTKSGNASSFGLYQLLYRHPFFDNFEVGIGYTVMASGGISGDLGYGVDLSAYCFPFTPAEPERVRAGDSTAVFTPIWRPYGVVGFYQRQFQSVQTGYAGPGFGAGVERQVSNSVALRLEARYIALGGSSTSSANTTDIILGVSFGL